MKKEYKRYGVLYEAMQYGKDNSLEVQEWVTSNDRELYRDFFKNITSCPNLVIPAKDGYDKVEISPRDFLVKGNRGYFFRCSEIIFVTQYKETMNYWQYCKKKLCKLKENILDILNVLFLFFLLLVGLGAFKDF